VPSLRHPLTSFLNKKQSDSTSKVDDLMVSLKVHTGMVVMVVVVVMMMMVMMMTYMPSLRGSCQYQSDRREWLQ